MGYKTVSLTEEAYRRLAEKKQEGESFSDVVLRLTVQPSISDFIQLSGALKRAGVDKEEIEAFKKATKNMWQ